MQRKEKMASNLNAVVTQTNETHINEKTYVFTWVVKNLNLDLPLNSGQFITSPAFQIDCKSYKLKLHPDGITGNYKNYMVVDVPNKCHLLTYRYKLYLVNKNGNKALDFSYTESEWHILARSQITRDFLPNDHLTIKWKLYYYVGEELLESLPKQSIENIAEKRRVVEFDDFEKLLKDHRFSDIKIVIDKHKFSVHKNILAARSRYFAAMFESNMKEVENGEIHITNISAKIMQQLLRFIYTGKIDVEITMITDLLIVADMYGLNGLSGICEEAIMRNISVENLNGILTVIDQLGNVGELKTFAIEFLTKNAKMLYENEAFKKALDSLSHSFVVEITNILMSKI